MRVLAFDVGTKTLSYCLLEFVPGIPATADAPPPPPALTVHAWETTNIHEEVCAKTKPTMKDDSEYMIQVLSARVEKLFALCPDAIMIEQQPAGGHNMFSSVRMKCLSHVIHGFFYTYQLQNGGVAPVPVGFVSPSSKLVGMDTQESSADTKARQAGDRKAMGAKYRKNKRHAVDMTTALLDTLVEGELADAARATFRAAAPKQDDVSDAFMLAYAYAKNQTQKAAPKKKRVAKKRKAAEQTVDV